MKNKVFLKNIIPIVFVTAIVIAITIYFFSKQKYYTFYHSEQFRTTQYLVEDIVRYYYNNNYHIPSDFAVVIGSSEDFFKIFDFSEDVFEAYDFLRDNENRFRIIHFPDHDSLVVVYNRNNNYSDEMHDFKAINADSLSLFSFVFSQHRPILFATISYADIHICSQPFYDYLTFNNGKVLREENVEALIHQLNNDLRMPVDSICSEIEFANILFRFWVDQFSGKWTAEVICNNYEIEVQKVERIKNLAIYHIDSLKFENHTDSIVFPIFVRNKTY